MKDETNTGIAETMKAAATEVEELKNQTSAPKGVSEEDIAKKVSVGLTRAQAVEVLEREAAEAAEAKPKGRK
jgi:ABC-type iron transport system FetAB permease component